MREGGLAVDAVAGTDEPPKSKALVSLNVCEKISLFNNLLVGKFGFKQRTAEMSFHTNI